MSVKSSSGSERSEVDRNDAQRRHSMSGNIRKKLRRMRLTSSLRRPGEASETRKSSSCSDVFESELNLDDTEKINDMGVYYLEYIEVRQPGLEDIVDNANRIYMHHKPYLKTKSKSYISVDDKGIKIRKIVHISSSRRSASTSSPPPETQERETLYKPQRIKYCGVMELHPKVFLFNYQHGSKPDDIQIHVMVCDSKTSAKSIAKTLNRVFQVITRRTRQSEKHKQEQHKETLYQLTKSNQSLQRCPSYKSSCSNASSKESWTVGSGDAISPVDTGDSLCVA